MLGTRKLLEPHAGGSAEGVTCIWDNAMRGHKKRGVVTPGPCLPLHWAYCPAALAEGRVSWLDSCRGVKKDALTGIRYLRMRRLLPCA